MLSFAARLLCDAHKILKKDFWIFALRNSRLCWRQEWAPPAQARSLFIHFSYLCFLFSFSGHIRYSPWCCSLCAYLFFPAMGADVTASKPGFCSYPSLKTEMTTPLKHWRVLEIVWNISQRTLMIFSHQYISIIVLMTELFEHLGHTEYNAEP